MLVVVAVVVGAGSSAHHVHRYFSCCFLPWHSQRVNLLQSSSMNLAPMILSFDLTSKLIGV
jgi:hypothetical protein